MSDMKDAPLIGKDALGREVRDLSVLPCWGIQRKEIKWYPEIDYGKCVGCGLCFITCGRRVFDWDKRERKPLVARPYNCMVACTTCQKLCPANAIIFPEDVYVKRLVATAGIVKKAREMLEDI